jgi:hypothetical protein
MQVASPRRVEPPFGRLGVAQGSDLEQGALGRSDLAPPRTDDRPGDADASRPVSSAIIGGPIRDRFHGVCRLAMPTEFLAQNGAVIHESTKLSVSGCPKNKKATKKKAKAKPKKKQKKARG